MRSFFLLSLLAACGSTPTPVAPVEAPVEVAAPVAAPTPAGTELAVDNTRSGISWTAHKLLGENAIALRDYTGKVWVDGDQVTGVAFVGKMASLEADQPKLTTHLLNADFFNVEVYPESSFTSTSVAAGSKVDGFNATVTGDLTVMGITKTITFPAAIELTADQVAARAAFDVDRRDFKLVYPGMPDNLIKDIVPMEVHFVALRK